MALLGRRPLMMSGVAPAPAAIKLYKSSCGRTHAGMYRGAATPSPSVISAFPCRERVFVSIDTSIRRFFLVWAEVRLGLAIQCRVVMVRVDRFECVGMGC